jgi:hypothetical protein
VAGQALRILAYQVTVSASALHITFTIGCELAVARSDGTTTGYALLATSTAASNSINPCTAYRRSKRHSYQRALVRTTSEYQHQHSIRMCSTRYPLTLDLSREEVLPRLTGMRPAVVSPRHRHVHGGRRGQHGGTCAATPLMIEIGPVLYTVLPTPSAYFLLHGAVAQPPVACAVYSSTPAHARTRSSRPARQ